MAEQSKGEPIPRQFSRARKLRPCYLSIDMRTRVAEPCYRYLFNDRIHFLDDRSLQIYQEGLKRHHGVFTVATYEAIMNAPHVLTASTDGSSEEQAPDDARQATAARLAATGHAGPAGAGRDAEFESPSVVALGYYSKSGTGSAQSAGGGDALYRTVQAWYCEKIYAENSALIPFFVGNPEAGVPVLQSVALSRGDAGLGAFFATHADNYNFTPLCIPGRLQQLREGKAFLLAMYRDQGERDRSKRIHSAAEMEYASLGAFRAFVAHALTYPEHCVVKVLPGPAPLDMLPMEKKQLLTAKLRGLSHSQADSLDGQLQSLQFFGLLADMSDWARQWTKGNTAAETNLFAWVGGECRAIHSGKIRETLALDRQYLNPEIIRFGYVERRREARYLARTAVTVEIRSEAFEGITIDLSRHGLRVSIAGRIALKRGALVKVGLRSVQQKRTSVNIMSIPYRIVDYRHAEETVLMLERVSGNQETAIDDFFDELVEKNRDKLSVDTGDVVNATASGVFEVIRAVNAPALAFFLSRDPQRGASLRYVVLPARTNAVVAALSSPGNPDFSHLFTRRMVRALYDGVHLLARKTSASAAAALEFDMLVYGAAGAEPDEPRRLISEFDTASRSEWLARCKTIMADGDWRGLRVVVTPAEAVQDSTIEELMGTLRRRSGKTADSLSDELSGIVGCGEIFDISRELEMYVHC